MEIRMAGELETYSTMTREWVTREWQWQGNGGLERENESLGQRKRESDGGWVKEKENQNMLVGGQNQSLAILIYVKTHYV